MPEITQTHHSIGNEQVDRQLLLSLALSPMAAVISTIVGFIVAHWIVIVAYKRTGYLVSACSFTMCGVAAGLAWRNQRKLVSPDEIAPENGRRLFMAKLALLLSALCALVVLAGTLVLITLSPDA